MDERGRRSPATVITPSPSRRAAAPAGASAKRAVSENSRGSSSTQQYGDVHMQRSALLLLVLLTSPLPALAQGTQADYDRALGLRKMYEALVGNAAEAPRWVGRTHKLYYRRTVKDGHDFILVDADAKTKAPAFDHAGIAASLNTAAGTKYGPFTLPFNAFDFVDDDRAIQFVADNATWRCTIADSACRKATPAELQQ